MAAQLDEVDRPPQKRSKALGPKSRAVVKGAVAAALVLGGLDAVMAWGLPAGLPTLFSRDPAVAAALRERVLAASAAAADYTDPKNDAPCRKALPKKLARAQKAA